MGHRFAYRRVELLMRGRAQPFAVRSSLSIARALIVLWCSGRAGADTLEVADSVRTAGERTLWSDSLMTLPDSALTSVGMVERWWVPVGLIFVSAALAVFLFTARSR